MTKRLDPEIKALRAITRALAPLNQAQTQRSLEWVVAQRTGRAWFHLPRLTAGGPKASNTDTAPLPKRQDSLTNSQERDSE